MLNSLFKKIIRKRTQEVVKRITPYIKSANKIVDIGSGTGDVAFIIKSSGKDITPVDVADFYGPRMIKTTIYDGKTLPFTDKSFDEALLLMVLHHTPNPEIVFQEAMRVADKIVVIETSYNNFMSKVFTVISDTIGNLRVKAFWSSYKSDREWRDFFDRYGFKIKATQKYNDKIFYIIPFLHILYYLEKK